MQHLATKPFALLGVNMSGCDASELEALMRREDLSWRSFVGQDSIGRQWNRPGTPTLYLIDHRGVIRRKWLGLTSATAIDLAIERLIPDAERDARR